MRKVLVSLLVLALSIPSVASALTYSPTVSDLGSWSNIGNSSSENTSDLSSFSQYALHIYNVNESIWNYSLFGVDSSGFTDVTYPATPVTNGDDGITPPELEGSSQETDGLNLEVMISGGVVISQEVPIPADRFDDPTNETAAAPVPEPGTMILLGAGFLGLAVYGKRRKNG